MDIRIPILRSWQIHRYTSNMIFLDNYDFLIDAVDVMLDQIDSIEELDREKTLIIYNTEG